MFSSIVISSLDYLLVADWVRDMSRIVPRRGKHCVANRPFPSGKDCSQKDTVVVLRIGRTIEDASALRYPRAGRRPRSSNGATNRDGERRLRLKRRWSLR